MSERLLRLKIHIWVHSAIGAALLVGLPTLAFGADRPELSFGVLPGLFIWSFGFGPLRRKASALSPQDRIPARGLPAGITCLLALGAFMSPFGLAYPFGGWIVAAWLLLGATIVLRWLISRRLAISVHGATWGLILMPVTFWTVILGFLFALILMVGME